VCNVTIYYITSGPKAQTGRWDSKIKSKRSRKNVILYKNQSTVFKIKGTLPLNKYQSTTRCFLYFRTEPIGKKKNINHIVLEVKIISRDLSNTLYK
jgi:hypothetical protein